MAEQTIKELIAEIEENYQVGAIGVSTYKRLITLAKSLQ